MSLVCYGSSDSEEESEDLKTTPDSEEQSIHKSEGNNILKSEPGERNVPNFNSLSKPILSKGRETVKITIPSLDQFKDEDIKIESKQKPTFKGGSGLLSMLPPPKYSGSATQRGFTPHVLTKQKNVEKKVTGTKAVPKKSSSVESIKPASISKAENSSESISANNDEEDDDSTSFDFFSLESVHKKVEVTEKNATDTQPPSKSSLFSSLPEPIQNTTYVETPTFQEATSTSALESSPYSSSVHGENYGWNENYQSTQGSDQAGWSENYQDVPQVDQADTEPQFLQDEMFKKMLGRKKEEIRIIDVNADDQLTGREQWLMQSLTEEKVHRPSKRKGEMPTQQQKRKHQITYLAFQAKERELDLKNQWALNSRTRRETQAKYGF